MGTSRLKDTFSSDNLFRSVSNDFSAGGKDILPPPKKKKSDCYDFHFVLFNDECINGR